MNEKLLEALIKLIDSLDFLFVILLIVFFRKITRFIVNIFSRFISKSSLDNGIKTFLNSMISITVKTCLVLIILQAFGINLTNIVAIISALGVILGFAFKETMGNFAGGLMILIFKPFKIGDTVYIDGSEGTVKKIELFYTTILNYNNENIIIPNGIITTQVIQNLSINGDRRFELKIKIGYGVDIDKVRQIINDIINSKMNELYSPNFKNSIGIQNIENGYVEIEVKVHVLEGCIVSGRYYLLEQLAKQLEKENIKYPYSIINIKEG